MPHNFVRNSVGKKSATHFCRKFSKEKIPIIINPEINESKLIIKSILEFFSPEYLNVISSLLLNSLIKNNWDVIKNINGNMSKIKVGELRNAKKKF